MFDVILSPEAQTFFTEADQPLVRKLARCFAQLEQDPRRHNNIKRLAGEFTGKFRYRVGDWRVLYSVDDQAAEVHVLLVAHRSEIYD